MIHYYYYIELQSRVACLKIAKHFQVCQSIRPSLAGFPLAYYALQLVLIIQNLFDLTHRLWRPQLSSSTFGTGLQSISQRDPFNQLGG